MATGKDRARWYDESMAESAAASNPELLASLSCPVEDLDETIEIMPMRFFGDQALRRVTEPITDVDGAIVDLASRMLATMRDQDGVGLAGPQVGRSLRIFVHKLHDEAPTVLINPQIVESDGEWVYSEGCLSIPGLYYDVVRPERVHIKAINIEGNEFEIEADEFLARVAQHEIDHLDGVLFIDRLTDHDRRDAERELRDRVAGTLGTSDPFLTGRPIRKLARKVLL